MSSKVPKKLPCINCRQQKARCDVVASSGEPCSRCARLKQSCEVSSDYKRQAKRRRSSRYSLEYPLSSHPSTQDGDLRGTRTSPPHDDGDRSNLNDDRISAPRSSRPTQARSLDDFEASAGIVDETFSLYFSKFNPLMPILNLSMTPNECYESSHLLFWAIVGIAGQSLKDTSLSLVLSPKLNKLAITCVEWRESYLISIKALLLLLTWPLLSGGPADISFSLAGTAIHMAMTIGLHMPLSTQEFSRAKINLTEADIHERAELWTHCLIAHGRVCCMKGIAAMRTHAVASDPDTLSVINSRLSSRLAYQSKLHRIVMRCNLAVQKNGLRTLTLDQERAMEILTHMFTEQFDDVAHEASTEHDRLLLDISRLQCQAFYFFKVHKSIDEDKLVALHLTACRILRAARTLDESEGFLPVAPIYYRFGILIAAYVLLRLLKSPFGKYLDTEVRDCFLSSIDMARRMSPFAGDQIDKHATALRQLWHSTQAFKKSDGSDYTILRIRTRLAVSVAFDAVWWWKEEFLGLSGVFETSNDIQHRTNNISTPSRKIAGDSSTSVNAQDPNYDINDPMSSFDDRLLAEFGLGTRFDNDLFMGWPDNGLTDTGSAYPFPV